MTIDPRIKILGALAAVAVLVTGVVQAQPAPSRDPTTQVPPQEPAPKEIAPPAPGETTPVVAPPTEAAPPVTAPPVDDADKNDEGVKSDAKPAEIVTEAPVSTEKRQRHGVAIVQALDKITAETMRFEATVGRPVRYKGLVFTVRSCETSASDEPFMDSMAYMEVRSEPKAQTEEQPSKQVFHGWMFASAPGLNALQHPVYDAWLIACKT
jgi:hypothetical protein